MASVFDLYELSRIIRASDSDARQELKTTLLDLIDEDAKSDILDALITISNRLEEIQRAIEGK